MMIFKVDIEKAFDSVNWRFIDSILAHMRFPDKWRRWVKGTFESARSSILINGSPTAEFDIKRGVGQDDALSPFLFIIVMEVLNVAMKAACSEGLFRGVQTPRNGPCNSSLWIKVISSIHRGSHKWEAIPVKRSLGGSWKQICQADKDGYEGNSRMMERLQVQVGRGDKTLFWLDKWVSEHPLIELFPGLFALEKQKDVLLAESYECVANVMNWKWRWKRKPVSPELQFDLQNCVRLISSVMVSSNPDCWLWKELNGKCSTYSVKSLRWELDNSGQQVQKSNFWLKWLPIKINCFIWRLLLDRIATKCALNTRGINVGELGCAVCDTEPETAQHLFMHCKGIKSIWAIIFDWVKLP
ncbi:uncharacterized protein LOC143533847 [Bidens hawaiensis]|uniref:uncharacterized protein LOC143533847 n=1 Tax=Bidens hawaiensis TaxID=980011 RepID=UPI00404AF375